MCARVWDLYSIVVHFAVAHVMYDGCCDVPVPVHFV